MDIVTGVLDLRCMMQPREDDNPANGYQGSGSRDASLLYKPEPTAWINNGLKLYSTATVFEQK